jgi:tight adherence protein B
MCFSFLFFWVLLSLLLRDSIILRNRLVQIDTNNFSEKRFDSRSLKKGFRLSVFLKRRPRILQTIAEELYLAGIALKSEEFLLIWAGMGIVVPFFAHLFGARILVTVALVVLGSSLPVVFVRLARDKSLRLFDKQLPDALDVLCNSLKAGFSFQTAMDNIASEMSDPIAREFKRVSRECHYGMSLEESLNKLTVRSQNRDFALIVSAVLIQRQVGGNLAQVLASISDTIRQRMKLRSDIKVMTSAGVMSGSIVGLMPVFLLLVLMLLNPEYVEILFVTSTGRLLLLIAFVMECLGFFFVRKIVNIKL